MTSLRWGFLSTCGPHDVHVLNVLDRICPVSVIFRPEREPENIKTESKHEILSVWKNYNEEKRKKRLLDLGEFVLENLHTKESFTVPIQPVDIPTAIIKSDEFHNYLQEYNLDLLFVSSAPILSEKAFTTPSLGSINLHYGFVPNYRGEHTLVWPFMERDFAKVGITLHRISKTLDGGAIIARATLALSNNDNEGTLWEKGARAGAKLSEELFTQLIETGSNDLRKQLLNKSWAPQKDQLGKNIKFKDRTLFLDLYWKLKNFLFLFQKIKIKEKVEWFI